MRPLVSQISILFLSGSLLACNTQPPADPEASAAHPAPAVEPVAADEVAQAPEPGEPEQAAPLADLPAAITSGSPFSGTVVETMSSAGYSYLLLDIAEGQYWVAAQQMLVSVGDRVDVAGGSLMRSFHSNTLDRTFDTIVFATGARVANGAQPPPPDQPTSLPSGHPPSQPTSLPSGHPPDQPTSLPSGHPPSRPTSLPSGHPPIGGDEAPAQEGEQ